MIARLRTDLGLVGSFVRADGGPRAMLVVLCTALVSGLLLVALAVVLFSTGASSAQQEQVSGLVADGGVVGGYVFALVSICLAPLALLRQAVRLGTAAREQRLAALRLAGATPGDVRRLGALEIGIPALAGGLLGYLVFGLLRAVFGGTPRSSRGPGLADHGVTRELGLVPTTVGLAWWQVLLVALAVGLVGALAGATASRHLLISPLGVSRRAPRSAPRPWGLLLLALAIGLVWLGIDASSNETRGAYTFGAVGALVVGLLALAPWVAYRGGRIVAARASTVPVLIAGRRLATDARPAGRAAAAVGAIALAAGGGGALLTDLPDTAGGDGFSQVDPFYIVPLALGAVVLLAALLLVVFSMGVHGVESLLDHKRSAASLAALGVSATELEQVQRWEVGLVAVPMAVIGVLVGSVPLALMDGSLRYAWIPLLVNLSTVALVWAAVGVSTRMIRPWLVRATSPANLRTP